MKLLKGIPTATLMDKQILELDRYLHKYRNSGNTIELCTTASSIISVRHGSVTEVRYEIAPAIKTKKRKPTPQKVIHNGFVYHLRLQHHGKTRYFRCAKERYTGCTATAKLDNNLSSDYLKVIRPHNHPPDTTIEIKVVFENQLRKAVESMTNMDNRNIYNLIAAIYPDSAEMFPFGPRLNCKMKRWRRSYLEG